MSDCGALTEKSVKYPLIDLSSLFLIEDELLINLSEIYPSLAMASSILFTLSSDSVVGITALSPSKLLNAEIVGVLAATDAEDTSTVLVVLLPETLEAEENEEEFFIGGNDRDIICCLK